MFRRPSLNRSQWFRHSWQNRLNTVMLLTFLGGYMLLLGWMIWGSATLVWLLAATAGLLLLAPTGSPHLLMKLSGARLLSRQLAPDIHQMVERLAQRADLGKHHYCIICRHSNRMHWQSEAATSRSSVSPTDCCGC